MIDVAAGVIVHNGKILIARRKVPGFSDEMWEFPGGKIRTGETPEQCLVREIREELDMEVEVIGFIGESIYKYPNRTIRLLAYVVRWLDGEPRLKDHSAVSWVSPDALDKYEFAPADVPIVRLIVESTNILSLKKANN